MATVRTIAEDLRNLLPEELIKRANDALNLPTMGKQLPPEDECVRVELAQRYVNLALSIILNTTVQP